MEIREIVCVKMRQFLDEIYPSILELHTCNQVLFTIIKLFYDSLLLSNL